MFKSSTSSKRTRCEQKPVPTTTLCSRMFASFSQEIRLQSTRPGLLLAGVLLLLLQTACATSGRVDYSADNHKQVQAEAIDRWNRCFDQTLAENYTSDSNAERAIRTSLVVCQGHREDVLAVFPRRIEEPLDQKLVTQAYQHGMVRVAGLEALSLSRGSGYKQ